MLAHGVGRASPRLPSPSLPTLVPSHAVGSAHVCGLPSLDIQVCLTGSANIPPWTLESAQGGVFYPQEDRSGLGTAGARNSEVSSTWGWSSRGGCDWGGHFPLSPEEGLSKASTDLLSRCSPLQRAQCTRGCQCTVPAAPGSSVSGSHP